MQVQHLPIYQFLQGSGKSFVIPVYQRDYAWTRINCQKLWDDLVDLIKNKRIDHFLGTIVTVGSGFEEYTVIDGQQRLTTTSIILIALHNFLKNKEQQIGNDNKLSEQILEEFLINKYSNDQDKRIRLKPNKQDKEHFDSLFNNQKIEDVNSNVVSNYNFFYDKIKSEEIAPADIFNAFRKFKIVLIDLVRNQDDPQLIFESLNSTGKKLESSDLIRNFMLMDLHPIEQERFYKNYWVKIEELTGNNIAEFIRNYLIYKNQIWVKKDDVYEVFKKFSFDELKNDKEGILKDLLYFSEIYSWLLQINKHPDNLVNKQLERLDKLEFTVCHPYFFDAFHDLKNKVISAETVIETLKIIESYAFRKILVDNTTQGLNKMFITLSKEIKKEEFWEENYLNILNLILLEKRVSQRFPTNEEFENLLINKEIYRLQAKNKNFLLQSLENYKNAYSINVDELTVEHIMPQTLTKEWKIKLGENWQEVHKKYVHTLGNLSLTAKNSELSNNSFEDKQQIDFQTSKLKLNYKLDKVTAWNEEKIIERAKDLVKNAKDIWPFPKTTYTKPIAQEQKFDLTSEDNFRGSKTSRLYFENDEIGIEIKTWRDLLIKVCKFLYEFSPTEFINIEKSDEFKWLFDINKPLANPLEFYPNHFVEGRLGSNAIFNICRRIAEKMNYQLEDISFSIKNIVE